MERSNGCCEKGLRLQFALCETYPVVVLPRVVSSHSNNLAGVVKTHSVPHHARHVAAHLRQQAARRMEPSGHREWAPASNRRTLATAREHDQGVVRAAALLRQSECRGVPFPRHRRCNCRQVVDGGGLGSFHTSVAAGCQRDVDCQSCLSLLVSFRLSFLMGMPERT